MKKIAVLFLSVLAVIGCTNAELIEQDSSNIDLPIFHASFERLNGNDTKTYVEHDLHMYWNEDDRLSIFTTTYNQQFRFCGKTGDTAGDFEEVKTGGFHSGSTISTNYAVYPYSTTTSLSYDGTISLSLPSIQQYAEGSFGDCANTMVAVTRDPDDHFLQFKNLCGYLVIKLFGDEIIKSITLKGNDSEKLAGIATVSPVYGSAPTLTMSNEATTSITLDCGDGIALGKTADTATEFWLCVPPVTFTKGFSVTATSTKGICTVSTSSSRTMVRNVKVSMPAIEFIAEGPFEPEAIDLGLPSGIRWASFNLGASKPEEYGDYYAWGATEPWYEGDPQSPTSWVNKGGYALSNTPFLSSGDNRNNFKFTKYLSHYYISNWDGVGHPDNKLMLDPEDDAARFNLGGHWRMPTDYEIYELSNSNNCKKEWTTLNGIGGYKFTSKRNGNSIFLPAAGYRSGLELINLGSHGEYWSAYADLNNYPYCSKAFFDSTGDFRERAMEWRYYGQSIRPVNDGKTLHVKSITLNKQSITIYSGTSRAIIATIEPIDAHNKIIIWSSSNTSVATVDADGLVTAMTPGTATITAKSHDGGAATTCKVTVEPTIPEGAVDMGLSVYWAAFNLGASKPEDCGDYYAWGEVETYYEDGYAQSESPVWKTGKTNGYDWDSYKWSDMTKYNTDSSFGPIVDNKTVLDLEDDAAYMELGGTWRMPTEEEFEELTNTDNCAREWTTINGIAGYKFFSRKTDNSIFIPAVGYYNYTNIYDADFFYGHYWSSSLPPENPSSAKVFCLYSSYFHIGNQARSDGLTIRPVCE